MKFTSSLYFFQGDFLLIVLKNLIEKQSDTARQKLKVVLMYVLLNDIDFEFVIYS